MRTPGRSIPILLVGFVGVIAPATGLAGAHAAEAPKQVAQAIGGSTVQGPVYKPPLRGAPAGRVGGGTRGAGGPGRDVFVLSVLAPDHNGLTVSQQPTLYWFISADTALPVEFAIIDPNATDPLLEKALPVPVKRGVHQIRLADHGVKLQPGIAYRWSVTVVPDSARRSRDILASGVVELVQPPTELAAKLPSASKSELPSIYAEAGIWYDAVAAISTLIDAAPGDVALQRQRASLLAQAGLPEVTVEDGKGERGR